nr:hypothetical protein GCM10020092_062530 [Actinoplanes digitatis]
MPGRDRKQLRGAHRPILRVRSRRRRGWVGDGNPTDTQPPPPGGPKPFRKHPIGRTEMTTQPLHKRRRVAAAIAAA